jgi:predicted HTH domain antitoxin
MVVNKFLWEEQMKALRNLLAETSITEKYILMLLYAAGGKVRGKLWFEKEMFELSKAFSELADELEFNAYSYGPFSEALDEYVDMLENSGLITFENSKLKLTDRGFELAKIVWNSASERERSIVESTVKFLEELELDELLLYIYATHPEMAEKSDVKDKILRKREEIALRMLEKGKISLNLAAKLANMPETELIERAIKHGIKPFDVQGDIGE